MAPLPFCRVASQEVRCSRYQVRAGQILDILRNRLECVENGFWRYEIEAEHQCAIRAASESLRNALERHAIA
ncbi:MAG TPA: hypothetical protein VGG85_07345 [Terracidiphilus sp.]